MTDQTTFEDASNFTTLDGIRSTFETRQRDSGKGFHALGEEVLAAYWQGVDNPPKPVSAMTFRNFLQGKTTLRDPTGLELYFRVLGASEGEMRVIRGTLQHELDRRIASPRQQAALRPFDDVELESMPYSRALVECEVVTRLEDSISAPVTLLTPREYLLGPDGVRDAPPNPERWGLVHHLQDLARYIETLDHKLADELEAIPRRSRQKRRVQAAADLRETMSAYAHWLLERPRAADLLFSRRRFMLHGHMPEEQRALAIALAKRCAQLFFATVERLSLEVLVDGKEQQAKLRTPKAENALELVTEKLLAQVHAYYQTVVHGALGTGAVFRAVYQFRRENREQAPGWDSRHERLVTGYDETVSAANRALEEDVRLPYGKLKQVYDNHFDLVRPTMFELWHADYAPLIVRDALTQLAHGLMGAGVLNERAFLALTKDLFVSRAGAEVLAAKHAQHKHERLDRT